MNPDTRPRELHGRLVESARQALSAARGRELREDPRLPGTGGPAGNARLTAWIGLLLVPLFAVESLTLLALDELLSWHVVVGVLLVPVALAKTASTSWRIARYYTGHGPYRRAGPPPLLLRMLGPLVVLATLAALGSGLALVALGPDRARRSLISVVGQRVDAVTVHQGAVIVWAVVTGLHVLARLLPAVRTVTRHRDRQPVMGGAARATAVAVTLVVGGIAAVPVLHAASGWSTDRPDRFEGPRDDGLPR